MLTITIKLKPYLQEYIRCKLNEEQVTASRKNFVGTLLRPFLEYRPKDLQPGFNHGEEFIEIELPTWNDFETRRGTTYISPENNEHFERILDKHFKDLFFSYADDKIRYTNQVKQVIMQFCSDYNFTFNKINYEMLKKSYYRHHKGKNPEKVANKVSLSCPPDVPALKLVKTLLFLL